MAKIYLIILLIILFSCKEKETEFIESKTMPIYLIKNIKNDNHLVKKEIRNFVLKKYKKDKKNEMYIYFYKYTTGTSYFLKNKEDDGGPTSMHFLSNYDNDKIAYFILSKCKNDTTKLVGKLKYYNNYGDYYNPDTLIYKCK